MNEALAEFFKHNLWANLIMLDFCAELSDEQLDASVQGTYGSIRSTLVHLFGAEERYVMRLTDVQPTTPPSEQGSFPGFAALRKSAQQSGEALIAIAEQFDSARVLSGTWRGEPYTMRAIVPLLQAINHATEHRIHIATIVSQQGLEPPNLDAWEYGDIMAYVKQTP